MFLLLMMIKRGNGGHVDFVLSLEEKIRFASKTSYSYSYIIILSPEKECSSETLRQQIHDSWGTFYYLAFVRVNETGAKKAVLVRMPDTMMPHF